MEAMILAAGLGNRLRPFSESCPKPLFPVLGKPLLLHILSQLRSEGFDTFTINSHYLSEQFKGMLSNHKDVHLQIEENVLGTGGGMRLASGRMGGSPVLVVNGDVFHSIDLKDIYKRHLASGAPVSLVVHNRQRFNNLRVSPTGCIDAFRVDAGNVSSEKGERLVAFTGIHVIDPDILKGIPANCFYDIIDFYGELLKGGTVVNAIEVSGHFWSDMGTPNDYLDLHRVLLTDKKMSLPAGFYRPEKSIYLSDDVEICSGAEIRDWASIGAGARIGKGAEVSRSVVWNGAVVSDGAVLKDEIIVC